VRSRPWLQAADWELNGIVRLKEGWEALQESAGK
jgi:hypothetical protein